MILLLHPYSRANRGDGLLVDLALQVIRDALGDVPVTLLATDADSFSDLPRVFQMPGPVGSTFQKMRSVAGNFTGMVSGALRGQQRLAALDALLPQTKLVVGVGGAYLRAGHLRDSFITAAVQLPQLRWAASCGKPTIYLPQSIGPLKGPMHPLISEPLAKLNRVYARDDRTITELGSPSNMVRCPDMAVLELGKKLPASNDKASYKKVYLVARDIPRTPEIRQAYYAKLNALRALLPEAEPLVQSRGRGNDDAAFYGRMGWNDAIRDVGTALNESGPGIMVAVRLHGALQAMLAGCPTVHLTYERKGFGAYDDLGIAEYLHTAAGFDPATVATQVRALQQGAPFWSRVAAQQPTLQAHYAGVVAAIRELMDTALETKTA